MLTLNRHTQFTVYSVCGGIGSLVPFLLFQDDPGLATAFTLFGLVILVTCIPQISAFGLVSWSAGIPLYYLLLFFALPLLEQVTATRDIRSTPGVSWALLLATAGIVAFQLGNRISIVRSPLRSPSQGLAHLWPFSELQSTGTVAILLALGIGAVFFSIQFGYFGLISANQTIDNPWAGLLSVLSATLEIVLAASWIRVLSGGKGELTWRLIAWCSLLVLVFTGAFAVSKSALVKPFAILALAYYLMRGRFPLLILSFGFFAYVFIAFPLVAGFRSLLTFSGLDRLDLIQNLWHYLLDLRIDDLLRPISAVVDVGTNPLEGVSRSLLIVFATIVKSTGDTYSYLYGESYLTALATIVPKLFWEDKPLTAIGNFIGQRYGFLAAGDEITNISPSQMGEAYMNFGAIGIFVAMFLWGMLARFVDKSVSANSKSWVTITLFLMIAFQEAPIAHTLVPTLKLLVTLVVTLATISAFKRAFIRPGAKSTAATTIGPSTGGNVNKLM